MARKLVFNPGRTARFYRANEKSRRKHVQDETARNDTPKKRKYRRDLAQRRRDLKIMGKGGGDVVKRKGKLKGRESMKINRGRGGAKRK